MQSRASNLRSFHKELAAGEIFNLISPWLRGKLTLYNPNEETVLIWCGPIPDELPDEAGDDAVGHDGPTYSGDLETTLSGNPTALEYCRNFVETYGIPLKPGSYWEPYASPSSEIHIVCENSGATYQIRGIV